jgi:hypothetical protein
MSADRNAEPATGAYTPLPNVLRWFWAGTVISFFLMILVVWLEARAGWPKSQYALLQEPNFADLLEYIPAFRLVHTEAFFGNPVTSTVAYPPFGAVMFPVLYALGDPVRAFLIMAALAFGGAFWGVRRALVQHGINPRIASPFLMTLGFLSFPIWRLVPQGNIELFLWLFAAAGIWAYLRGYDDAAAVLWALSGATKLYPVIFLVLFLPRLKFRAFFIGVATFVGVSVLSLLYLGPTIAIAWRGSLKNVFGYQGVRVAEWTSRELVSNHSFFTLVKLAARAVGVSPSGLTMPYYLCGAIVFAAVFFGRVRKMPVANQLLVVSLFMVMLPPVSYFHTLVHLYAPWLILAFLAIRAARANVRIPGLQGMILLFLPLFSSFTLYSFPNVSIYGGVVQACLLTVLIVGAVRFPFALPVFPEHHLESGIQA